MALTIVIGLLVTRLLIKTLGISDFGLLMTLGAAVGLMGVIREALAGSGERYMAHAIGRDSEDDIQQLFASSLILHLVLAGVILIVGLLLMPIILSVANVPDDRETAAIYVLGASIGSVVITISTAPYMSIIAANQEIPARTAFELANRVFILIITLILPFLSTDQLASYSWMTLFAALLLQTCMVIFCSKRYPACRRGLNGWRMSLIRELLSFGGLMAFGSMTKRMRIQGTMFLLNVLYSTTINAAYAIAVQASSYQMQLSNAILTAIKPAMATMHGRHGQSQSVIHLVCIANKFPFFLTLFMFIPVVWETEALLKLWLGEYPEWTPLFVRLSIATALSATISQGYYVFMSSRGELRGITLIGLFFQLSSVAIGWVGAVVADWPPEGFLWAAFITTALWSVLRVGYVSYVSKLSIMDYLRYTALPITIVSFVAIATSSSLYFSVPEGMLRVALLGTIPAICICFVCWTVGLTGIEREHIKRVLNKSIGMIRQKIQNNTKS
ncbi:MAG: hypothetical protein AAGB26_11765 [Planctomycetota bacterium]